MPLDSVDRFDRPLGETVLRREVFAQRANFRVAHVLLWSADGRLLVQQLATTRDRHPGSWGSSVAAYLFAGEGYEAAARRRLREELSIRSANLEWLGKLAMDDEGCIKFIGCFSARSEESPLIRDSNHIRAIDYLPLSEIRRRQAEGEMRLTPTFDLVLRSYYRPGAI